MEIRNRGQHSTKATDSSAHVSGSPVTSGKGTKGRVVNNESYFSAKKLSAYAVTVGKFAVSTAFDFAFMPPLILKESYKIARANFGLAREKWFNNFCFATVLATTFSNFWVNPMFDEAHSDLNRVLYKINEIESDDDFYSQLNTVFSNFIWAVLIYVVNGNLKNYFDSLLNNNITAEDQKQFLVGNYLKNAAYHGVQITGQEGDEDVNHGNSINPAILYFDYEEKNKLLSLVFARIDTFVDLYTAYFALKEMSAVFYVIGISYFAVSVPHLFGIAFMYALMYTVLSTILERPVERLQKQIKHLRDSVTEKVSFIAHSSEQVAFHRGDSFEARKIQNLHREKVEAATQQIHIKGVKDTLQSFLGNFDWVMPILSSIDAVRSGQIEREKLFVSVHNCMRVKNYFSWTKDSFSALNEIKASLSRIELFTQRVQTWEQEFQAIDKKFHNASKITFSGTIYHSSSREEEAVLARGDLELAPGNIYHFDARSGSGKTTLFRTLARIWPNFDGVGTLPKEQSVFVPSMVYILGSDEPLLQSIAYPQDRSGITSNQVDFVKESMCALNLKDTLIDKLEELRGVNDTTSKEQDALTGFIA